MKHTVKIRIKTSKKSLVLLKLNKINVELYHITYLKDYLVFEVSLEDLKRIEKYLVSEKLEVIEETGIYKLKQEMKRNMLFILSIFFALALFFLLSNVIIKVNIIHESKEIRELLTDALKERGVSNLSFKKNYQEYETIIEEIKNEYKDKLEWLEIDVDGMIINVRVEERIINEISTNTGTCHVVAKRSGIITSILTEKGVTNVKIGDYVEKGDILISGEIKLNEEVKNNVCASGEVYAEVWYTVSASVPMTAKVSNRTGKMRYNLSFKNNNQETVILKSRVEEKEIERQKIFSLGSFTFYLQKEYEIETEDKTYTEEEALEIAKNLIYEKLETMGIQNSDIMNERYLKKSVNNGNLDIELFVAVKEQIGVQEQYSIDEESDTNDAEYNGDNS